MANSGGGKIAPQKCPDCGSDMWDNSATKRGKQPDYVCKDKECRKGVWVGNRERNANQATAPAGSPSAERPVILDSLFSVCFDSVATILDEKVKKGLIQNWSAIDAVMGAAAIMGARTRQSRGILKMEKDALEKREAAEREAAERRRREEEERERERQRQAPLQAPAHDHYDDGLPF